MQILAQMPIVGQVTTFIVGAESLRTKYNPCAKTGVWHSVCTKGGSLDMSTNCEVFRWCRNRSADIYIYMFVHVYIYSTVTHKYICAYFMYIYMYIYIHTYTPHWHCTVFAFYEMRQQPTDTGIATVTHVRLVIKGI